MTNELTPAELAELRRLHEAATPDPWTWSQPGERVLMRAGTADYMDATHRPDSHGPANISLAVAARNALPELLDEIERLRGLLSGEAIIKKMMYTPEDGVEVEVQHWAVKHIAADLATTLGPAPNFVTMTLHHPDQGPIEVTVRRAWGKTVAAVQAEQLAEIERLRAELAKRPKLWAVRLAGSECLLQCPGIGGLQHAVTSRRDVAEGWADRFRGTVVEYTGAENG